MSICNIKLPSALVQLTQYVNTNLFITEIKFGAFPEHVLDVLPPLQWWQMWVVPVSSEAHPWHSLRSLCALGPTWAVPGVVPQLWVLAPHGSWQRTAQQLLGRAVVLLGGLQAVPGTLCITAVPLLFHAVGTNDCISLFQKFLHSSSSIAQPVLGRHFVFSPFL